MKVLFLIGMLAMSSVLLLPAQKNIEGTWVLDTGGKKCEETVIRIQMMEGYFTGHLDIPEQEIFDRPITVQFKKEKLKILLNEKGNCFIDGKVSDSVFTGQSFVCGKTQDIKFRRIKN